MKPSRYLDSASVGFALRNRFPTVSLLATAKRSGVPGVFLPSACSVIHETVCALSIAGRRRVVIGAGCHPVVVDVLQKAAERCGCSVSMLGSPWAALSVGRDGRLPCEDDAEGDLWIMPRVHWLTGAQFPRTCLSHWREMHPNSFLLLDSYMLLGTTEFADAIFCDISPADIEVFSFSKFLPLSRPVAFAHLGVSDDAQRVADALAPHDIFGSLIERGPAGPWIPDHTFDAVGAQEAEDTLLLLQNQEFVQRRVDLLKEHFEFIQETVDSSSWVYPFPMPPEPFSSNQGIIAFQTAAKAGELLADALRSRGFAFSVFASPAGSPPRTFRLSSPLEPMSHEDRSAFREAFNQVADK